MYNWFTARFAQGDRSMIVQRHSSFLPFDPIDIFGGDPVFYHRDTFIHGA
jgi:hypothetical protein